MRRPARVARARGSRPRPAPARTPAATVTTVTIARAGTTVPAAGTGRVAAGAIAIVVPADRAAGAAATAALVGDRVRRASLLTLAAALIAAVAPDGSPAAQPGATVRVRASRRGFQPSSLNLRRGEPVHVVLSSADGEHCFAVDELRIEKRIVPGRETRFDLTPERAGSFVFHCCLESGEAAAAERGQLTVAE